ncbi:Calumenin-B [Trichoplax sp. H2]|uniref:Reticulocalbin-3 n=1 Tax=Trichoplax adhaerens TaxID=10228 RepID=B3RNM3_TRIAD|nr:expressed hypothetical protein [Trichoplax adhaerens]EDV27482.1 expressed hypothetical protein [Trichoplax adhaerens]RDD38679.1 Calumenin-B [Trichoplax sp. H2]|eukprot:XP_002109316.1 expressed hypothetical protein [Trichoplax adhaerens]
MEYRSSIKRLVVLFCFVCLIAYGNGDNEHEKIKVKTHHDEPEEKHYLKDGQHNPDYDAEMFLGRDRATLFKELPEKEVQERLRSLLHQVDTDHDKIISEREMEQWLRKIDNDRLANDAKVVFEEMDDDKSKSIDFKEISKHTFGDTVDEDIAKSEEFSKYVDRERRKFALADIDNSESLSFDEFVTYQHPERHQHLSDVVVTDVLNEIDKNNDGYVEFSEMIGDSGNSDGKEDDWIKNEKKEFAKYDKDGDQKLSTSELKEWVIPDRKYIDEEVQHLLEGADTDHDGRLTIREALAHQNLLAGSKLTDYGNLNILREEL